MPGVIGRELEQHFWISLESGKSGKIQQKVDELSTFYKIIFLHQIQRQLANSASIPATLG